MDYWQALTIAAVPSVAAVISAWVAFRDLGLRRRLETSQQFLSLFALAHGRPESGRSVGVGEQIATLHLIADFAAKEQVVRNAAEAGLAHIATWSGGQMTADQMEKFVHTDVREEERKQVAAAAADALNQRGAQTADLAQAAREALERLQR